jgi:hypothetical protein
MKARKEEQKVSVRRVVTLTLRVFVSTATDGEAVDEATRDLLASLHSNRTHLPVVIDGLYKVEAA